MYKKITQTLKIALAMVNQPKHKEWVGQVVQWIELGMRDVHEATSLSFLPYGSRKKATPKMLLQALENALSVCPAQGYYLGIYNALVMAHGILVTVTMFTSAQVWQVVHPVYAEKREDPVDIKNRYVDILVQVFMRCKTQKPDLREVAELAHLSNLNMFHDTLNRMEQLGLISTPEKMELINMNLYG